MGLPQSHGARDASAVKRLLALLSSEATPDAELRATFEHHVVMLLGASYGHAGPEFLALLTERATEIAATTSRSRLDLADLTNDSRTAADYLKTFRAPIAPVLAKAIAGMSVRRDASTALLPEIRKLLSSKEQSVRLVAGLLILQLSPGDVDAGPLVLEEYAALLATAPGGTITTSARI